jgi:hypothetical protein
VSAIAAARTVGDTRVRPPRISQSPNTARLVPRSREYDVGADREPESVIADNLYFDEHANDRKDHQYEREHKPKVHCAYLLALRRNAKNLAWSVATGNVRDLVASSKATSEIPGPRSMLSLSQSACVFAVVLEWKIVMLNWTMNAVFYPGRPTQAVVRCRLKGRLILAFLRALVGAFKAVKLSSCGTLFSASAYGIRQLMGEKHLQERSPAWRRAGTRVMDAVVAKEKFACS